MNVRSDEFWTRADKIEFSTAVLEFKPGLCALSVQHAWLNSTARNFTSREAL